MSLKLLIDEDSQDKLLVSQLKQVGHDVLTVTDLDLLGQPDHLILARAVLEDRVLLTSNCDDFAILSAQLLSQKQHHPGILLVRKYNNPTKDMNYRAIVQAIANLEIHMAKTGMALADQATGLVKYRP